MTGCRCSLLHALLRSSSIRRWMAFLWSRRRRWIRHRVGSRWVSLSGRARYLWGCAWQGKGKRCVLCSVFDLCWCIHSFVRILHPDMEPGRSRCDARKYGDRSCTWDWTQGSRCTIFLYFLSTFLLFRFSLLPPTHLILIHRWEYITLIPSGDRITSTSTRSIYLSSFAPGFLPFVLCPSLFIANVTTDQALFF